MTRRLAIVPARGGSKRIPRKNIRDFCGKPMIGHILDTVDKSNLFETVHISTEDQEVADIVTTLGFEPEFLRPDNLAGDDVPIMPVLKFVCEKFSENGHSFDEIWLLMACAPLIDVADLEGAARLFAKHEGRHSMLAVCDYAVPIEWAFEMSPDGILHPCQPGMFAVRSNDLAPKYHDSGTFAVFSPGTVLSSEGAGADKGFLGYPLSRAHGLDIDTMEDWAVAEALFRAKTQSEPETSRK